MFYLQWQLEGLAKQLQEQQHDLGSVILWCSLNVWALSVSDHSQSLTVLSEIKSISEHSIRVLLCKVVIARQLDVELGLALLFCLGIDAGNPLALKRQLEVTKLRSGNQPTVPVLLGTEKQVNIFLRADQPAIAECLGLEGAQPVEVFGKLRELRNSF